jgi:hypothetical protein
MMMVGVLSKHRFFELFCFLLYTPYFGFNSGFRIRINFKFLDIKALDPDWIRIRIRIDLHPDPLDPDPDP